VTASTGRTPDSVSPASEAYNLNRQRRRGDDPSVSLQAEHELQRLINSMQLSRGETSRERIKAFKIHREELFDQYPCGLPIDIDLGSKRRRGGAARHRCDQHRGERQQCVGLDNDAKSLALLMTAAGGQPDPVDVPTRHSGQSAERLCMSAITASRSAESAASSVKRCTSAAKPACRSRRWPASARAVRIASDSLRPSRISEGDTGPARSSSATLTCMDIDDVSVRELRNHTAEVLRRVESGERVRITVDRRPVAELGPLPARSAWVARERVLGTLVQADPELTEALSDALADTIADL
jgi:prevent-host-death family protein